MLFKRDKRSTDLDLSREKDYNLNEITTMD